MADDDKELTELLAMKSSLDKQIGITTMTIELLKASRESDRNLTREDITKIDKLIDDAKDRARSIVLSEMD
jgi:hypothetical protein